MAEDFPGEEDTDVVWKRVGAQIIDNIAAFFLSTIPLLGFFAAGFGVESVSEPLGGGLILIGIILFIGVNFGFEAFLEYWWKGRSLGKRAVGIKVVKEDGSEIEAREAVIRNIPVLGFVIPYFGILAYPVALMAIASSNKRQRLFDRVADTVVVEDKEEQVY
jgi:uncharacterized RDD family membrane protein YckC